MHVPAISPTMRILMNIRIVRRAASVFCIMCIAAGTIAAAPTADSLLKRLGVHTLTEAVRETGDLNAAAKRVGLTREEFITLCRELNVDISALLPAPEPKPSLEPSAPPVEVADIAPALRAGIAVPSNVLALSGKASHLFLVEKASHRLFVLEVGDDGMKLTGTYQVKTGSQQGDKQREGDHRTPEGVFFLREKYPRNRILSMVGRGNAFQYGDMAFVTNYPTPIDLLSGKDGGGIWLHGDDEPFEKRGTDDSRGCVVTTNESIRKLDGYVRLHETPLLIVDTVALITPDQWRRDRAEALALLERWRIAWEKEDLDAYIGFYHSRFADSGRNRAAYRSYKEGVFAANDVRKVALDTITALRHKDGLVLRFRQNYVASNLSSTSNKVLYLVRENGSLKIVAEQIER